MPKDVPAIPQGSSCSGSFPFRSGASLNAGVAGLFFWPPFFPPICTKLPGCAGLTSMAREGQFHSPLRQRGFSRSLPSFSKIHSGDITPTKPEDLLMREGLLSAAQRPRLLCSFLADGIRWFPSLGARVDGLLSSTKSTTFETAETLDQIHFSSATIAPKPYKARWKATPQFISCLSFVFLQGVRKIGIRARIETKSPSLSERR